jgi:hypothetical protein
LAEIPGGLGAYSESPGAAVCRRLIAGAIERRDGFPCSLNELYMTVRRAPRFTRAARGGRGCMRGLCGVGGFVRGNTGGFAVVVRAPLAVAAAAA